MNQETAHITDIREVAKGLIKSSNHLRICPHYAPPPKKFLIDGVKVESVVDS